MMGAMFEVLIYSIYALGALFVILMQAAYMIADIRERIRKEHPPLTGLSDDDH